MQQNTKGLLLFVFLISVSVVGINFFNNNAYEESLEVKIGTILSTAAKAGLNPDTLKDNPQLDNSLKLIEHS